MTITATSTSTSAVDSTLGQPIKVWTCAVKTPDSPGLIATVHATEDECFEWLRDNHDPEGEADDEPPVAIVGHLEDWGYLIHIDVHEMPVAPTVAG